MELRRICGFEAIRQNLTYDRVYQTSAVILSIGLATLVYRSPLTQVALGLGLYCFAQYLKENTHLLKRWQIVVCLVSAAVCFSTIPYATLVMLKAFRNIGMMQLSPASIQLLYSTGVFSYVFPIGYTLYRRGRELLGHTYQKSSPLQKRMIGDKIWTNYSLKTQRFILRFLEADLREKLIKPQVRKLFDDLYKIPINFTGEITDLFFDNLCPLLLILPQSARVEFLYDIIKFDRHMNYGKSELSHLQNLLTRLELWDILCQKKSETLQNCELIVNEWDSFMEATQRQIDKDNSDIVAIVKDISKWNRKTSFIISEVEFHYPEGHQLLSSLKAKKREFDKSPLYKEIIRRNSSIAATTFLFDPSEPTDVYFSTGENLIGEKQIYDQLFKILNEDADNIFLEFSSLESKSINIPEFKQEFLNESFQQYQISTMGDFVKKVLGNDATILEDREKLIEQLTIYIKNNHHLLQVHSRLQGSETDKISKLAWFVANKVAQLFFALSPIIVFPREFLCGIIALTVFQTFSYLTNYRPSFEGKFFKYMKLCQIAHPFFNSLNLLNFEDTDSLTSNWVEKMNGLNMSMLLSVCMLYARIIGPSLTPPYIQVIGVGSFIHGISVASQAVPFLTRNGRSS